MRLVCYYDKISSYHTLRLFPVVSFNASNPPGPILLLRDFLDFSTGALFLVPSNPISAVWFSWSTSCAEGTWPNDFRDFGRVVGRVTSSREDMIVVDRASKLEAICKVYLFIQCCSMLNIEVVIIGRLSVVTGWPQSESKQSKTRRTYPVQPGRNILASGNVKL